MPFQGWQSGIKRLRHVLQQTAQVAMDIPFRQGLQEVLSLIPDAFERPDMSGCMHQEIPVGQPYLFFVSHQSQQAEPPVFFQPAGFQLPFTDDAGVGEYLFDLPVLSARFFPLPRLFQQEENRPDALHVHPHVVHDPGAASAAVCFHARREGPDMAV